MWPLVDAGWMYTAERSPEVIFRFARRKLEG
jgi:hypothetical protein